MFKLISPQVDQQTLSAEMGRLSRGGPAFFYAKLPTSQVAVCLSLVRAGFFVVDTGITLAWAGSDNFRGSDIKVSVVRPDQHQAVADIAARCFRWSRFHLDPQIPADLASRVKRRWVENYCRGQRGSVLYVGETGASVAGFLAVIESRINNHPGAVIDLVGVAPEFHRRGVGSALVKFFVNEWQGRVDELRVGTQAANIQSLRFYGQHDFRIVDSSYTMHSHFYNGQIT